MVERYYMIYTKFPRQKTFRMVDVSNEAQVSRELYATRYSYNDLEKVKNYVDKLRTRYDKVKFQIRDNHGNVIY